MTSFQLHLLANSMLFQNFNYLTAIKNNLMQQLAVQLDITQSILSKIILPSQIQQDAPNCNSKNTSTKAQIQSVKKIQNSKLNKRQASPEREIFSIQSKMKNDTKNIPKNYGKAILTHIQKNIYTAKKVLAHQGVSFAEFMSQVRKNKTRINSIADLRKIWGQGDCKNKVKKCFRMLSHDFMRKHCLLYIFNSRVKNFGTHIKYRRKIISGIQKPSDFTNIKEY